jgi:hypothetical protein
LLATRNSDPNEGPEHEPRRHHDEVDHRDVLQPVRVDRLQGHVDRDDRGRLPRPGQRRDQQAPGEEPHADGHRDRRGDLPCGHRPAALDGVLAVGLGVGHVVEAVRPAGGQAERHEDHHGVGQVLGVVEHPGRRR